jgi:hypothetical protein
MEKLFAYGNFKRRYSRNRFWKTTAGVPRNFDRVCGKRNKIEEEATEYFNNCGRPKIRETLLEWYMKQLQNFVADRMRGALNALKSNCNLINLTGFYSHNINQHKIKADCTSDKHPNEQNQKNYKKVYFPSIFLPVVQV